MRKIISALLMVTMMFMLFSCNNSVKPGDETKEQEDGNNVFVYVAVDGDDNGSGTVDAPFATIAKAKEYVKTLPQDKNVTVYFRGGRYQLSDTIVFTDDDRDNVLYSAYENEKVSFSFGMPITDFKDTSINTVKAWKAEVPEDADFDVLSTETEMLSRSRYPSEGFFKVKWFDFEDLKSEENRDGNNTKSFMAYPADLIDFYDITQVDLIAPVNWNVASQPLESVDTETGRVVMQGRTWNIPLSPEVQYYFENVKEAVEKPGQWYLDREQNTVYYIPREGEVKDNFVLYAAGNGSMLTMDSVDGITFKGITFRDSDAEDWIGSYGQACAGNASAIRIDRTNGITFESCEFRCIGRSALCFKEQNKNGTVNNCVFDSIGMAPLYVAGTLVMVDSPAVTEKFTITNNLVQNYGIYCAAASGINLQYVNTALVANNEIHDGYYTGISVGWTWEHGENPTQYITVKDNLIYNIGFGYMSDMGGIYLLGEQEGTVVSGNVVHDVQASKEAGGYGGNGIYLDQGSSFITVEKNLVYNCGSDALTVNGTCDGVIFRNNIVANSGDCLGCGVKFIDYSGTLEVCNNILTTNGKTVYNIYENGYDVDGYKFSEHDNFIFDFSGATPTLPEFSVNATIADPLFTNAAENDFTLSEGSPALAGGFETWDYSAAGRK